MQKFEIDLSVGDELHLGEYILTVIDVERGEISVRLDRTDGPDDDRLAADVRMRPPR